MKFYRTSSKIFILLTVIFILCHSKMALADEKPVPISPAEVKSSPAPPQQTAPAPIIPQPGKLNRNTIGCVLPLSGKYAEWGNKALDAIMLSAGISNKENKTPWEIIAEDSQVSP